ncbi:hypothetical protein [Helicobacter burdigaliensis]|uniref:hypothetical protein n=1 Tax=Helicobacter burdigaliensis TaxID=2315334 RepID=UPI000EF756E2|nr:hypothetical protein [Helicobacter burdigaliensis]
MQISNHLNYSSYNNIAPLNKENKAFGILLQNTQQEQNLEVNQTNKIDVTKEENMSYGEFIGRDLMEVGMLGAASFISAFREAMEIQGINDPQKIDSAILGQVRQRRNEERDPQKVKEMLEQDLKVLKEPYSIQKGYYMEQIETEEHFQARKDKAIDYLLNLLQTNFS